MRINKPFLHISFMKKKTKSILYFSIEACVINLETKVIILGSLLLEGRSYSNREENTASLLVLVLKLGVGLIEIYFVIASRIIFYAIFVYGI